MKFNFIQTTKVIALAAILAFGVQYATAQTASWVQPGGSPPSNNIFAPINVGASGQIKTGGITLGSGLSASGIALNIPNGKVMMKLPTPPTVGQVLTAQDVDGTLGWSNATGGGGTNNRFFNDNNPLLPEPQSQVIKAYSNSGLLFGSEGGGTAQVTTIGINPNYSRLMPQCSVNGQVPKVAINGSGFPYWSCGTDNGGGGTVSLTNCTPVNAVSGGTTHTISCPAGKIMTGLTLNDANSGSQIAYRVQSMTCCTLNVN